MKKEIVCGIYKITSPSNKVYIGQAIDVYSRWDSYKHLYCSSQIKLYNSFKKYGWENHKSEIIYECDKLKLNEFEIYYGNLFNCLDLHFGLNIKCLGTNGSHSEETKKKISLSNIGKKHSEETKIKIGDINRGRKLSEEHKQAFTFKNRKHSIYAIEKIRKSNIGQKRSEETKQKCSEWQIGRKHTEETKQKMSKSRKGINTWSLGSKRTEETKQKMRLSHSDSGIKIILNILTGIYYIGLKDAAKTIGVKSSYLSMMLLGNARNNTPFIYT